jgi:hypothetical protein
MWKDLNLRTLSELEVSKQHQSNISNRFAALENLNYIEAWENIKENTKSQLKRVLS